MIYLYLLFAICYLLFAIWRPKWALFLICALLPTYQIRFKIFSLPTTLLEVMILILFICWFIKRFKILDLRLKKFQISDLRFKIQNWKWLILAWLIASLIAVVTSPDKWLALGHWRAYFLEPILILIVFLSIVRQPDDQKLIVLGLAISALYCSVWAILQKWLGGGVMSLETWQYPLKSVWRATGPFPQPNFLGLYLGPIAILIFGQLVSDLRLKIKDLRRILFYFICILLSCAAIILGRSEGAILGVLAGFIFLGLIHRESRKWVAISLIILIIIGLSLPNIRNYLWQKTTFHDFSGQIRLKIWSETLIMLKERPIFGAGLRGYQVMIEKYHEPYLSSEIPIPIETQPYPHNLFLAIWSELGILGLIVFLIIIFQFFKLGFRKLFGKVKDEKILIITVLSAMVTILIHGLVDTPYFKNDLAVLFWLIVGLVYYVCNRVKIILKFLRTLE